MKGMISIIIPFYNSKKTIRKCVESLINQTYKNFEAIFVNDGGTDETIEILKGYQESDNRIVIIDKGHSGVSATRNVGIKNAKGEFIQFLDSDDYLEHNMFEKMISAQQKHNADVVVCNFNHPSIKNYLGDCVLDMDNKKDLLKYVQSTFAMVVPWNKLYRRSVIVNKYDEKITFTEDDLFALSNLKKVKKVVSISDKLYNYYVAPSDTSIEESSCINAMAKSEDFYKTKNTYWYGRRKVLKKSLNALFKHLDYETALDCGYSRMFDFMIWEILIMDQIGVNRDSLIYEVQNVFKEKEFQFSLELKNKYGLFFRGMDKKEQDDLVKLYCKRCYEISDYSSIHSDFKAFDACLMLFIEMFMIADDYVDDTDLMGRIYNQYVNKQTIEASYVLNKFFVKEEFDNNNESYAFCRA